MSTKHLLITLCILLQQLSASAQGENAVWTMGVGLGLDFNTIGGPSFSSNAIDTWEGSASVSDASGNLLFYSDGSNVYDRTHHVMPNGMGLLGNSSTTQGVAIAKLKGSDDLYCLFTLTDLGSKGTLSYSVIDMSFNGGLGDVEPAYKNVFLRDSLSEKMIIAGDCEQQWVLVHDRRRPKFYAYPIESSRLIGTEVTSVSGSPFSTYYDLGQMKISHDMATIVFSGLYPEYGINTFDFDHTTGVVSNYRTLDTGFKDFAYSFEFSPDNSKLYLSTISFAGRGLYQYDLTAGSPALIAASKYTVAIGKIYGLRCGPDKKLYLIPDQSPTNFSRLRAPNLPGVLCDLEMNFLPAPFINASPCIGLGNEFIPRSPRFGDTLIRRIYKSICAGDSIVSSRTAYSLNRWFDGDSANRRSFSSSGKYWVFSESNCGPLIDTFFLTVTPYDTSFAIRLDTSLCPGIKIFITAPDGRDYIKWNDGDTLKTKLVHAPNVYTALSALHCSVFKDQYITRTLPFTSFYFSKDTSLCTRTPITFYARPAADSVKWFDGKTGMSDTISGDAGLYWVKSYKDCTVTTDTFRVILPSADTFRNIHKLSFCQGQSAVLNGRPSMAQYTWSTGAGGSTISTGESGTYWVYSAEGCDLYADTFHTAKVFYTATGKRIDTSICFHPQATLTPPGAFSSYLWDNGSTKRDTTLFSAGKASVTLTDSTKCTILKIDYTVSFLSFLQQHADTAICADDTVMLDASVNQPAAVYHWNTGDTGARIIITQPGTKVVQVQAKGCAQLDTIVIAAVPMAFSIGNDRTVCTGEKAMLMADISDVQYHWSTGETSRSIEVSASGKYVLTITKGACSAGKEVNIRFVNCNNCIAIPNAFSPNGDGINDRFKPILSCPPARYQLRIMNRWGQEVFSSSVPTDAWDGTSNGASLNGNTYFYMLHIKFEGQEDREEVFKGDITLIR
jgi:gliding motility-associated-like protein